MGRFEANLFIDNLFMCLYNTCKYLTVLIHIQLIYYVNFVCATPSVGFVIFKTAP